MSKEVAVERGWKMTSPLKNDSQMDKLASDILEHWNSKNIIVHRKCSKKIPLILKRITKDYSKEEIFQSIDNYARVYKDDNYYFDYKWNLETFLQKSNTLPDFMNVGSKWLSYLGVLHKVKPKKETSITITKLEEDQFLPENDNSQFIKDNYSMMLKSFRTMPYDEYLLTEHWLHFKAEALKNAQHKCKLCNTNRDTLHVHHNNYDNRGRETFNDVIVLCEECHGIFHGKT